MKRTAVALVVVFQSAILATACWDLNSPEARISYLLVQVNGLEVPVTIDYQTIVSGHLTLFPDRSTWSKTTVSAYHGSEPYPLGQSGRYRVTGTTIRLTVLHPITGADVRTYVGALEDGILRYHGTNWEYEFVESWRRP